MKYWGRPVHSMSAFVLAGIVTFVASARIAAAAAAVLTNGNSLLAIDTTLEPEPDNANPVMIIGWEVDDHAHLYEQGFWYRVGDVAEQAVNAVSLIETNPNITDNSLAVTLDDPANEFTIDLQFMLNGGDPGSGASMFEDRIEITNLTGSPLPFTLFAYTDLDLRSRIQEQTAFIDTTEAVQSLAPVTATVTPSIPADYVYADEYPAIAESLEDIDITDFSPTIVDGIGPTDATFAFQWDFLIEAGSSVALTQVTEIIPEPSTLLVLLPLAMGVAASRDRQRICRA